VPIGQFGSRLKWFVYSLFWDEIVTYRVAYRLPANKQERISIAIFLSQFVLVRVLVLCRILPRDMDEIDAWVRIRGVRFCVGLRTQELAMCDEVYRERIYEKVPGFIPDVGWIVFDVGAHIGVFTIQQALRGAQVFAFEPNPHCYRRLRRTSTVNKLPGAVHASNYAVGAEPGLGLLNLPAAGRRRPFGGTSVPTTDMCYISGRSNPSMLPVTMTSLDTIIPALGVTQIDLLNIYKDEAAVLCGAVKTLAVTKRVMIEYHSLQDRTHVFGFLETAGFRLLVDDVDANGFGGILHMQREGITAS